MRQTLKLLRQSRNLTQKEVAKKLGITKSTWSNYEKAKTFPDVLMIKKIEELFNVSYNEIIFLPIDYGLNVNKQE